jgi:GTP cyclohydrolase I
MSKTAHSLEPRPLSVIPPAPVVDTGAAEDAIADFLRAFGVDLDDPNLSETPRRVAETFAEFLTKPRFRLTTFANGEGYDELIVARNIPFHSLCQHHLLPFVGVAQVAYLPAERILGISKLARLVEMFARELQVQERMTQQIAGWLQDNLHPKGVGVILEAEHMCMTLRGVQKSGSSTVTSALLGAVRDDIRTRDEFLSLAKPS